MKLYNIVIVGATGMVGRKILEILEERKFPVGRIVAVARKSSKGKELLFKNQTIFTVPLEESVFLQAEIVFFAAGGSVSREWVPIAEKHCKLVIDNSSEFRMSPRVPLVVPEVNPRAIFTYHSKVIANPNCSTIQMVVALKPLHDLFRIRRIIVSTYQAVSGAGNKGRLQLQDELHTSGVIHAVFPHHIRNNALPHIDVFYSDGYTKEEYKMIDETRKILRNNTIKIAPTCVRIPVQNGHSESVNVQFEKPFELRLVREILENAPGVVVIDDPSANKYPLATDVDGRDEVFVGRLRRDESIENGLALWIVADNLRKGAATNVVQIAEAWVTGPEAYKVETN